MTTVMLSRDGRRRCDDACHYAEKLACDCICEGRYHGRGAKAAELLVRDENAGRLNESQGEFIKRAMRANRKTRAALLAERTRQTLGALR